MKLKTAKLTALSSAILLSLGLVACGGGGGGGSGSSDGTAGSSNIISSGTITGFGSVYVNGIKFETDTTSFNIEGDLGTQDDLAIGMVVQVNGVINADGRTGTATSIIFDDDLQGPIANYTTDGVTATFDVLGIQVKIDSKTTYFDPDNGGIAINTITNGQFVELSGFFDANGALIASRIESKSHAEYVEDRTNVELKGYITGLNGHSFTLRGINIDASDARLEDLPNGLQPNIYVEVEGIFNGTSIIATKVESEEFEYHDNDEFEVEGFITNLNGNRFSINGIEVDATRAIFSPRRMVLANNLQIEVEGRIVNNILVASELKMRGGEVELQAYISNVNYDNNTFDVRLGTNDKIFTIATGIETQFENDITDTYSTRLTDLRVGQFVEVEGYQNDDGSIFAVEVEIKNRDEIEIEGLMDAIQANQITVLGANFGIDSRTRFEGNNDNYLTQAQFEAAVTAGRSWVEIEDENHDGIADKIEIES